MSKKVGGALLKASAITRHLAGHSIGGRFSGRETVAPPASREGMGCKVEPLAEGRRAAAWLVERR